ncbi:putative non-specific serine/threonine protein kinase [Helianthus debilis subsp. tardiflorus]
MNLVDLVTRDGRDVKKFMDPRLDHNYPQQGAIECFELALRCVDIKRKDRPSSEEVLQSLEEIYALYK